MLHPDFSSPNYVGGLYFLVFPSRNPPCVRRSHRLSFPSNLADTYERRGIGENQGSRKGKERKRERQMGKKLEGAARVVSTPARLSLRPRVVGRRGDGEGEAVTSRMCERKGGVEVGRVGRRTHRRVSIVENRFTIAAHTRLSLSPSRSLFDRRNTCWLPRCPRWRSQVCSRSPRVASRNADR